MTLWVEEFRCPTCGAVSHHPLDIEFSYCGRCHAFQDPEKALWMVEDSKNAPPHHPRGNG